MKKCDFPQAYFEAKKYCNSFSNRHVISIAVGFAPANKITYKCFELYDKKKIDENKESFWLEVNEIVNKALGGMDFHFIFVSLGKYYFDLIMHLLVVSSK